MAQNTNTGAVLEAMILPALTRGGYTCQKQQRVGVRCGGRPHKVDAVAEKNDQRVLISLKWQQTGGTAEQKVPFEVMCLADAVTAGHGTCDALAIENPRQHDCAQYFCYPEHVGADGVLRIPERLLEFVEIDGDVAILGCIDHVEIMSAARLAAALA